MFHDSHIDIAFMSTETVVRPGLHAWHAWNDSKEDWMDDAYEFTTEVNDDDTEWGRFIPGEVLCYGWYNPDVDNDDVMGTDAVGDVSSEPLRGIWLEEPPPPPPPLPPPTGCPPLSQPLAAAPTTPPEAFMRPKAAPTASSASSASASASAPASPLALGAAAKSRWGPSAHRLRSQHQ